MRFSDFRLEGGGGGGKVRVLIAEKLIGDFAGEQHPNVGGLVDGHLHTRYMPMLARMVVIS